MKKLLLLALLVTVFGCWGPDLEEISYKYTVVNKSGRAIKIEGYVFRFPNNPPIITRLAIGETLTKTHRDFGSSQGGGYSYISFFGNEQFETIDSLKILYYEDTLSRVQYFTKGCFENKRNPINGCVYNGEEETFIFTEEDFKNAEPCNDCR